MTDLFAVEAIVSAALGLADPDERAAYLDRACGGDAALRARVERQLAARSAPGELRDPAEVLATEHDPSGAQATEHDSSGAGWVDAPGTVLGGRYELEEIIGDGGMGSVWAALQVEPVRRRVAIKLIKAGMGGRRLLARFEVERQALALMDHPNIARVFDGGEAPDGRPFIVMELVEGVPITRFCDDGRLTLRERLELFVPVCLAIQHAHQKGVIHRDIKPTNVLVASLDGRAMPKVIDFGIAKAASRPPGDAAPTTEFGVVIGTPEYMSPEQARLDNPDVDTRSDVYSLGVLLYELLAGSPPISREGRDRVGLLELLRAVREEEPPRPSRRLAASDTLPLLAEDRGADPRRLAALVRGELDWIAMKALEKDRSRRYESAGGLAEDVRRHLDGEPVRAVPPSLNYRLRKFLRRHRGPVAAAGLVFLALVAGLIGTMWGLVRADAERANAVRAVEDESRARRRAAKGQAELAMDHGEGLCEQGEIGQGLLWLSRSLGLAVEARDEGLDRASRINLAEWSARLARPPALLRAPSPAEELAFRPDGRGLVALGRDGVIRGWDADPWREAPPPPDAGSEAGLVGPLAFEPREGGRLLAFDGEGRGAFWDPRRMRTVGPSLTPLGRPPVRGAAFVEGGRRLVAGGPDGLVWWDAQTGGAVDKPVPPGGAALSAIGASPDGSTLVTGGEDGDVVFRDARDGHALGPAIHLGSPARRLAFLGEGRRIVALDRNGRVRACEGTSQVALLPPEGMAVAVLAVAPGGDRFATGTEGGTIRVWDSATLRQGGPTFRLDEAVRSLAFGPDGLALAAGLEDGSIRIWEVPRAGPIAPPRPIRGPARAVAFGMGGRHLLAVGDGGVERWCIGPRSGEVCHEPGSRDRPEGASAVSPDGRLIASATPCPRDGFASCKIILRDVETGEVAGERPAGTRRPAGVAFSPDSRRLVAWGDGPGTVSLIEVRGPGGARPLARSLGVAVQHAAFSPDGTTLLLGCRDGEARLWDVVRDVEIEAGPRPYHAYPITAVGFCPRSARVVTGCHAGTVRLWDRASGALLCDVRGNAGEVTAVAFSPDGKTLLTASLDATARFWDVASGRQLGSPMRHPDAVLCVAFHPDGRSVATGTRDGAVWRWPAPALPMMGDPDAIERDVARLVRSTIQGASGHVQHRRSLVGPKATARKPVGRS